MSHRLVSSCRRGRRPAAALVVLLGLLTSSAAAARGLTVAASVPVVVPLGFSSHAGAGIAPSLGWGFGEHLGLALTSGFVYYDEGDHNEREVPVLVGATWAFRAPDALRPYLGLRAGYTYAAGSEKSPHWMTVMGGGGVLIPTWRGVALDLGFDVVVPDVRGNSRDPVGLLLKLGVVGTAL